MVECVGDVQVAGGVYRSAGWLVRPVKGSTVWAPDSGASLTTRWLKVSVTNTLPASTATPFGLVRPVNGSPFWVQSAPPASPPGCCQSRQRRGCRRHPRHTSGLVKAGERQRDLRTGVRRGLEGDPVLLLPEGEDDGDLGHRHHGNHDRHQDSWDHDDPSAPPLALWRGAGIGGRVFGGSSLFRQLDIAIMSERCEVHRVTIRGEPLHWQTNGNCPYHFPAVVDCTTIPARRRPRPMRDNRRDGCVCLVCSPRIFLPRVSGGTGCGRRAASLIVAPRVSVVVPAYNSVAFIDATMRLILDQTFTDFELVVPMTARPTVPGRRCSPTRPILGFG